MFYLFVIKIIHLLLILYIIVSPFYDKKNIYYVITILIFILFRWITNNDYCTLTQIENKLVGEKRGFIYRLVNPIYSLNESKFNKTLYFLTFVYLLILIIIHRENHLIKN